MEREAELALYLLSRNIWKNFWVGVNTRRSPTVTSLTFSCPANKATTRRRRQTNSGQFEPTEPTEPSGTGGGSVTKETTRSSESKYTHARLCKPLQSSPTPTIVTQYHFLQIPRLEPSWNISARLPRHCASAVPPRRFTFSSLGPEQRHRGLLLKVALRRRRRRQRVKSDTD